MSTQIETTNLLLIKHPDLEPYLSFMNKYSSFDESGKLLECWVKDEETGVWHDITREELLKQEILDAQKEIDKLDAKIAKKQRGAKNVRTNT